MDRGIFALRGAPRARQPGRWIVLMVLVVGAIGACSGQQQGPPASAAAVGSSGPSTSNGPSLTPPSLPAVNASPPGPSDAPTGTSPVPLDMFTNHADPELEARLPAQVDATTLNRFSLGGAEFLSADRSAALSALLTALGKSPDDFSFAGARDATGTLGGSVDAYRVKGLDAEALRDGIVQILRVRAPGNATVSDSTLGGRQVAHVTFGAGAPADLAALPALYLYAAGDAVFLVSGPEPVATAILGAIQ